MHISAKKRERTFWSSGETTSFGAFSSRSIWWKLLFFFFFVVVVGTGYKKKENWIQYQINMFGRKRKGSFYTWESAWLSTVFRECAVDKSFAHPFLCLRKEKKKNQNLSLCVLCCVCRWVCIYRLFPQNGFVLWCSLVVGIGKDNRQEERLLFIAIRADVNLVHYHRHHQRPEKKNKGNDLIFYSPWGL